jgi:hypothetical protein
MLLTNKLEITFRDTEKLNPYCIILPQYHIFMFVPS